MWGGFLGSTLSVGLLLAVGRVLALRRPQLSIRVLPYVRDLPQMSLRPEVQLQQPRSAFVALYAPPLQSAAGTLERVLGGAASVRRRLERANLQITVHDFRIEQVRGGW